MRDIKVPRSYTLYRVFWSFIHIIFVCAIAFFLGLWIIVDGNGLRLFNAVYNEISLVSYELSTAIPFPWEG
mgnify:CR=1 FL=1